MVLYWCSPKGTYAPTDLDCQASDGDQLSGVAIIEADEAVALSVFGINYNFSFNI